MQTTPHFTPIQHRETWLHSAADMMKPLFVAAGFPLPERIRITCGFPSHKALGRKGRVIGQCWSPAASADQTCEVMVSLTVGDPLEVLTTLAHELCHAADGYANAGRMSGHKGDFTKCALGIGLQKPMRSTPPGPMFVLAMNPIITKLGRFPHAALDGSIGVKKQSTRMLKAACPGINEETGEACGYVVRVAAKHAHRGAPLCQLHEEPIEMVVEFPAGGEEEAGE